MRINAIPQYQYFNRNYQSPKHNVQFTGSQELFDAVWNGCIDAAESEIQSGTSINSKSKLYPYNSALMYAIIRGNDKVVEYLVQKPDLDINYQDAKGNTALHNALKDSDVFMTDNIVRMLIDRDDIDVTIKNKKGETAWDLYKKHKMLIRNTLVEKKLYDKTMGMVSSAAGTTPTQNPEGREMPTEKINNPKTLGEKRYPAASYPTTIDEFKPENNIYTQEQITDFFIKNLRNEVITEQLLETTPLIILDDKTLNAVMSTMDFELIEKVVDYKRNQTQMLEQYNKKRDEFLAGMKDLPYAELIKSQMVLNTPDGFKNLMDKKEFDPNQKIGNETLFERACKIDTDGTLIKKILIRYDDVFTNNVKSVNPVVQKLIDYYNTTGRYSVKLNNIERDLYDKDKGKMAMQQLKDFVRSEDYSLEITDFVGNSPAHIGATTSFECAKEIIFESMRKGFDINTKNKAGQTPLMLALKTLRRTKDEDERRNIFGIIKFILDKGADVNIQDSLGQSPLHYVCATDSPTALKLILSKNPNIALTDNNGRRARYYLEGKDEMTQIYREYIEA